MITQRQNIIIKLFISLPRDARVATLLSLAVGLIIQMPFEQLFNLFTYVMLPRWNQH